MNEELRRENEELRRRLAEAEDTLAAIREGQVDAIVVEGAAGAQVFSLSNAETVYRLAVESMTEAALNITRDGTILFCNSRFGQFIGTPIEKIIGSDLTEFIAPEQRAFFRALLQRCLQETIHGRVVFCGRDQQRTPTRLSGSALTQPDGNVCICLVATDLSELEDSAQQIEQLRQAQTELRESRRNQHAERRPAGSPKGRAVCRGAVRKRGAVAPCDGCRQRGHLETLPGDG